MYEGAAVTMAKKEEEEEETEITKIPCSYRSSCVEGFSDDGLIVFDRGAES